MRLTDWAQKIDLGREIQEVYVHSLLFKLAKKLIAIFIPLYLLELGYAPQGVIMFFLAYYMTYIFLSFPNAKIASKIGYKHTSLLASPIIISFYILLRNMQVSTPELLFVGVVGGIGSNLYWTGMNPEVATSSHSEDREKETGYFFSMPALASILSPLAGGLILAAFNFQVLLLFTVLLVALSFTPFLFSREHSDGMELDVRSFLEDADLIDFATFTFKGVNSIGEKSCLASVLSSGHRELSEHRRSRKHTGDRKRSNKHIYRQDSRQRQQRKDNNNRDVARRSLLRTDVPGHDSTSCFRRIRP